MLLLFFGIAGLLAGSFLNVCIFRIPLGRSVAYPPSACAECGHRLGVADLVPVFSYVLLGGKCRYCGKRISAVYPAVETLSAALFVFLYLRFGLRAELACHILFICLLVVAAFIDLKHGVIPDGVVVAVALLAVARTLFDLEYWLEHLIGLLAGGLPLLALALFAQYALKKEGMGGGDIKLMAAVGLYLGWRLTLFSLALAVVTGAIAAVVMLFLKKAKLSGTVPFGPFLSLGAVGAILFGSEAIRWYLSLLVR